MIASVSVAYNNVKTTDSVNSAGSYTQNQFQMSLSLGYTVTPRLSLSLSYTYLDLLTSQINSSYQRQQIYLGGTYTFR
jgi:predicted porin